MKLRPSSLPRIVQCAQAAVAPRVPIHAGDMDIPALGSACHDAMKIWIDGASSIGESWRPDLIGDCADKWNVPLADLQKLFARAERAWRMAAAFFPEPATEFPLAYADDDLDMSGTADVISLVGETEVRICDHKTGFADADYSAQLKGYAFLALKKFPGRKLVRASILRVRENRLHTFTWHDYELESWWAWLKTHLQRNFYQPDYEACGNCPRWLECDAGKIFTRQAAELLIELGTANGADFEKMGQKELTELAQQTALDVSPADAAEVIYRARLVEKASAFARGLVKTMVAQTGDQIEGRIVLNIVGPDKLSHLGSLEISTIPKRDIAYNADSRRLITDAIGDKLDDVCEISPTALDKELKEQAPRGHKSLAVDGMMAKLEEAGCLAYHNTERLDVKRAPKQNG